VFVPFSGVRDVSTIACTAPNPSARQIFSNMARQLDGEDLMGKLQFGALLSSINEALEKS
jgi:hypothetical protein